MTDLERADWRKLVKQWALEAGFGCDGYGLFYAGDPYDGGTVLVEMNLEPFAKLAMAYAAEEAAKIVNDWFDCETDYEAGRVAREIRERFKA